jgi:hypothetical protein
MSLNVMIAGCSKDERERIEAAVRAAFTGRPEDEPWNVSLVNVANQWSIDIDGPEPNFKGMSLVAPTSELTASLKEVLGGAAAPSNGSAPPPPAPSAGGDEPSPAAPAGPRKDRHRCEECAAPFEVVFDQQAGEPEDLCPVACPACWHVNRVPIAEAAGATGDYRAQAVS